MNPHVAWLIGGVGSLLVGGGVATFAGRRDAGRLHLGLCLTLQGVLLLAAALGGGAEWTLLVLVVTGVAASVTISVIRVCGRASETADVADWTPVRVGATVDEASPGDGPATGEPS